MRKDIFLQYHNLSRPAHKPSIDLITLRYIWPSASKDIQKWCKSCLPGQKAKITTRIKSALQPFPIVDERGAVIHLDVVGPLPTSEGYTYLLTCVDRFTRWLEAIPMVSKSADSCIEDFLHNWVARYGVPKTIITDEGESLSNKNGKN